MSSRAGFIRGLEKVGGFGGKATVLAESQVYRGDPGAYKLDLERIQAATPESVKAAANRWIAKGDYTLDRGAGGRGRGDRRVRAKRTACRSGQAGPGAPGEARIRHDEEPGRSQRGRTRRSTNSPILSFPDIQRGRLKNGIEMVLAERHTIPVVQMQLQFDAGYASDQGRKLGTSSFAMALLDEGTTSSIRSRSPSAANASAPASAPARASTARASASMH